MKNLATLTTASGMLAVLLVATGCTTGTPTSSPSDSATASVSANPSSSPTEEPIDLADPSSWIIDFDGVGPLTRGASISAERASMATAFSDGSQPEACPLVVFTAIAEGVPDIWAQLAAYPDIQPSEVVPDFQLYSVTDGAGHYIDFTVDPSKIVESIAISDEPVPPYEYCG